MCVCVCVCVLCCAVLCCVVCMFPLRGAVCCVRVYMCVCVCVFVYSALQQTMRDELLMLYNYVELDATDPAQVKRLMDLVIQQYLAL